jgi:DNA-binding transcriptional ArsR family regulator
VHKALADAIRFRLLEALWSGPCSAKEMARIAGVPPDRLYYHLKKLEDAGLIGVVDYRTVVGGKVERVYAVREADGPSDATDPEQVTAFLEMVMEVTRAELHAAGIRAKAGAAITRSGRRARSGDERSR